ncbi:PTR2-domain-containing protein [Anopheles sinensis]|uniref:PTR2-domain-containing protein n=1 Tax=Anopheles sinensis TaxID=74873 RepID=A0A084VVZ8_ANOSI|nr:PTR2-domain-containing protein [Anopheles sinensis]
MSIEGLLNRIDIKEGYRCIDGAFCLFLDGLQPAARSEANIVRCPAAIPIFSLPSGALHLSSRCCGPRLNRCTEPLPKGGEGSTGPTGENETASTATEQKKPALLLPFRGYHCAPWAPSLEVSSGRKAHFRK